MSVLYTIGHSNRTLAEFLELLQAHDVNAIADVRSSPYSEYTPHFNRDSLRDELPKAGVSYVFLGEELGARRDERSCYVDGKARYELIEQTPKFRQGLDRVRKGGQSHRIAIMCAEKDPLECHRSILISRALRHDFDIQHVLDVQTVQSHAELEQRLLEAWNMAGPNLFLGEDERLEDAYTRQAEQIAYVEKSAGADRGVQRVGD